MGKIQEFDMHAEQSLEENLAPVAKVFCPFAVGFLNSVEKSLTADLTWLQKIEYKLAMAAAKIYINVLNPQGLKDHINAISKLCNYEKTGFLLYMNFIYDIAARLGIPMPFEDSETFSKVEAQMPSWTRFLVKPGKMCTSVIFWDIKENSVVMGSNLDLPRGNDLAKMMYQQNFHKDGKLVFKSQHVFGAKGSQRAYSAKGNFFIALNERDHKIKEDSTLSWFWDVTVRKTPNPMLWIIDAVSKYSNLDEAMEAAASDDLSSPCYLIMSGITADGLSNGCVIERGFNNLNAKYCLSDSADNWFLVQTNWDRSIPDPKDDYRRVPMENKIKGIGRENMDSDHLYQFMSEHPNFRIVEAADDDVTMTTTIGQIALEDEKALFGGVWWNYDQE